MNPLPSISLSAPAKINLFLKILYKRSDGYHELVSWMQKLSLYDSIILEASSSGISLQCSGADIPEDENNLAYKAAALFFEETGVNGGVDITLQKKIPVAAGLGGGSSDAASVLKGLNTMFSAGITENTLIGIAKQLGADVPFFITDEPSCWATGVGEKLIKKNTMGHCWILLVNPGYPISTKWVYDNFALTSAINPDILTRFTEAINASEDEKESLFSTAVELLLGKEHVSSYERTCFDSNLLCNDLEKVTVRQYPEIAELKSRLLGYNATAAMMSGSGPTVFGVFEEKVRAVHCYENLKSQYPENIFLVKPICK